jgi:3-hydroxyisobutyrate dehydrogenase-like beta-hydroxyacid dehydrogenase
MSEHRIGWLGTGRMGTAMATRLISGGAAVTVWNRTAAKTAPLVQLGASRADTVSELDRCDIVFTSVTSSSDLLAVTSGPEGLFTVFSAQPAPRIVVDTSTVSAEVRREAAGRGIGFLSAPISGNANVVAEGRSSIGSVLGSTFIGYKGDAIRHHDYEPTFTTELLRKDFDLGLVRRGPWRCRCRWRRPLTRPSRPPSATGTASQTSPPSTRWRRERPRSQEIEPKGNREK